MAFFSSPFFFRGDPVGVRRSDLVFRTDGVFFNLEGSLPDTFRYQCDLFICGCRVDECVDIFFYFFRSAARRLTYEIVVERFAHLCTRFRGVFLLFFRFFVLFLPGRRKKNRHGSTGSLDAFDGWASKKKEVVRFVSAAGRCCFVLSFPENGRREKIDGNNEDNGAILLSSPHQLFVSSFCSKRRKDTRFLDWLLICSTRLRLSISFFLFWEIHRKMQPTRRNEFIDGMINAVLFWQISN